MGDNMSFRCEFCGEAQPAGSKPIRVVTLWRDKLYPVRFARDGKTIIDRGGRGKEVAAEKNSCSCVLPQVCE